MDNIATDTELSDLLAANARLAARAERAERALALVSVVINKYRSDMQMSFSSERAKWIEWVCADILRRIEVARKRAGLD